MQMGQNDSTISHVLKIHIRNDCRLLTFLVLIPDEEKKNKNFLTSLWRLKRVYEGLKGPHKNFWGITKESENKNSS